MRQLRNQRIPASSADPSRKTTIVDHTKRRVLDGKILLPRREMAHG